MTYCRLFSSLVISLLCATGGLFFWAVWQIDNHEQLSTHARRDLVRQLQLTDLAIWTEARYTRHPSQADLFTPFQEFPSAPEHFPAGSLLAPPPYHLTTQLRVISKSGVIPKSGGNQ